jgi:flagellar hook-length control protein FliK
MVIARTDNTGPRPLAAVESARAITPLGDTRQESIDRLVRLEVGKQFQAQILSRFNDGTFLVRIADTTARVALPAGGKAGDGLALTLLRTEPRPTFSLDSQTAANTAAPAGPTASSSLAAGARIAQALYLSTGEAAAAAPAAESSAAPAVLSDTARLVTDLLTTAQRDGNATALVGKVPVSLVPGTAAPQLASALQETLTFSGLFYESHVYQWANGERPLGDLLREPQARNSSAANGAGAQASANGTGNVPQPSVQGSVPAAVLEARRNLLEYFSAAPLPGDGVGSLGQASLDPVASQMINLQLNTLEQQRVVWHGELWPGQQMEWEVSREDQGRQAAAAMPDQENWQSVVRFSLPGLGPVSATIHLSGERVQIQVRTPSDRTASALRQYGPRLASALQAAGSQLDNLTIKRDGSGDGTT